jgi:hypothetical protein
VDFVRPGDPRQWHSSKHLEEKHTEEVAREKRDKVKEKGSCPSIQREGKKIKKLKNEQKNKTLFHF